MNNILDFNFYVNGLEQAILHLLKDGNEELDQPGMKTYVREFATYSGELDDRDTLINSIRALAPRFPLILAAYGSGKDKKKAATGMVNDEAIEFEHSCGFVVIAVCNDLRSERARKGTAFQMVADVRQLLGGIQFEFQLPGEEVTHLLNHSPFEFAGVETIGRLKDLTAFGVHFTTSFHEWTPTRRTMMVYPADQILLDIEPIGDDKFAPSAALPGVSGEIENL